MVVTEIQRPVDRFLRGPFVCLYGWIYAVYFGFVALDSLYAGQLDAAVEPAVAAGIFSEISDFLVMPLGFLVLTGAAAFGATVKRPRVLNPIVFSWLLLIALLGVQPLLGKLLEGTGYGTVIRLLATASGSVLATIGVFRFQQPEIDP
jgi:hypothetical protein